MYMSKYKTEKIKSRNLSEKKRRDQFNMLINELASMVSPSNRKLDKSSVLRATISFLKNHTEVSVQSQNVEVQENWKPSFLSNEEFTHLMLEALDGFIIVFSSNGQILYSSESTASLLGYLPSRIYSSVFDIIHEVDKSSVYKLISNAPNHSNNSFSKDSYISLMVHMKRGPIHSQGSNSYELVNLIGTFYHWTANVESSNPSGFDCDSNSCSSMSSPLPSSGIDWRSCFVAVGRLQTPHLLRVVNLPDDTKNEFTSRHSLEWKFLFLDHRAPPIIGYLPFEVLGTSGYDYYHVDDLDNIAASHELLMQTGEGTSCFYRFLTKGQQWIWLQTRYYISYHQWNSKPEFVVCTHTVVSTEKVLKNMLDTPKGIVTKTNSNHPQVNTPPSQSACISPSPSVSSLGSISSEHSEHCSTKTGSPNVSGNTVIYSNHENRGRIVTSPLARVPVQCTASSVQNSFIDPHPNLVPLPTSTGMNVISSTDRSVLLSPSNHELQVQVSSPHAYSTSPTSPLIMSTNVSGSQFQREGMQTVQNNLPMQEFLYRKRQMLEQQIMLQQQELRKVREQLMLVQYGGSLPQNSNDMSYPAPDTSLMSSNYVNTYSAPTSSSHMQASSLPTSAENIMKSVNEYTQSSQSYNTARSYRNLEAELCNVGTTEGLTLSSEQNSNVIAQSYSMTHSMETNS